MAESAQCHPGGILVCGPKDMLMAQITDTHVRRKGDLLHHMIHTGRELRRAVAAINSLRPRPDFVVATGDLVDRGKAKEYRRLHAILDELAVQYFLVAGNHDDPAGLRDEFREHRYLPRTGPLCYVVESRPVRLIALDTTRGRKPGGGLDAARLHWLDERLLEAPAVPTLIAMHHPPFDTGIPPVDAHPLRVRGGGIRRGCPRDLHRPGVVADRPQGVDEGHRASAGPDV